MIDIILLAGRLVFVLLLFVFLFAVMKTGTGLVKGQRKQDKTWNLTVEKGPKELRSIKIAVQGPVIIGRSPGSDIVIATGFVSGRHAKFSLMGQHLFVEDLQSTNGTTVNGNMITQAVSLKNNDLIEIGNVSIRARFN